MAIFGILYTAFRFTINEEKQIETKINAISIGVYYQFSFSFDDPPEDPWKTIDIDTVKVIDRKNGWVLLRFNQGFDQSMKEIHFIDLSKPINQKY